jgi:mono/diheme cytochrome c family protein
MQGAGHYAETCVHCHGAPGHDPAEWSRSMRPEPPRLAEAATEWSPEEIHWIVENGLKMTGMPAFGPHHTREELRAIAAFVSALPGLTAEEYASLNEPQ